MRRGVGDKVNRSQRARRLDELDQLITVSSAPLGLVVPSERRANSEGAATLVEVERRTTRGRRGSRSGNRGREGEPRGCERDCGG
jgi:hypothetical protein